MSDTDEDVNIGCLITVYFDMGMQYKDIVRILAVRHGVVVSLRHFKRMLRELNLFRRKNLSNIGDVIEFIEQQIHTSGRLHGYRWMYEKCKVNKLLCKKEDVRTILQVLDPQGTQQRRKRRLLRRTYMSKGPNYLWHFDSYDKLKRYGICINGCLDGFSRKVMWMNAYNNNSDPRIIGGYYIETVRALGGAPRMIRGDLGTENVYVRDIQRFLRRNGDDAVAGESSYVGGPSTANQRIEYWWSFLRRECMDLWICFFQNMTSDGDFSATFLDTNLLQFCFMHLIQNELDDTVATWNRHLIRPSRNARVPSGRPDVMYQMPDLYETRNYACPVPVEEMEICKNECVFRDTVPCDKDVHELCCILMRQNEYEYPQTADDAKDLYLELRHEISNLMNM